MVNADMFKNAFVLPNEATPVKPVQAPAPAAVPAQAPAPVYYEDPDIAKLKFMMLKYLSILIGGAAILLIVWRVILKFL